MTRRSLPHVALSSFAHDRHGLQRTDAEWVDRQWADPSTRVLAVAGSRILTEAGRAVWLTPGEAPPGLRVLLGQHEGVQHFAVLSEEDPSASQEWLPLRHLMPGLTQDASRAPLLLHAVGMAEWHRATRFCPRCAGRLQAEQGGHVLRCAECATQQFPRTDPAVIMLITLGEPGSAQERCLLGRSPAWPAGRYSTLAGFVEPGETMEDAVRREVAEETGVVVGEVSYFGSQPWPLPASLMIGFTGRARSSEIDVDGSEIEDARWFTRAELLAGASSGDLVLPGGVSISRSLVQSWHGGELPGAW